MKILKVNLRMPKIDFIYNMYISFLCIFISIICAGEEADHIGTNEKYPYFANNSNAMKYAKPLQINGDNIKILKNSLKFDFWVSLWETVQASRVQLEHKLLFVDFMNNLIAIKPISVRLELQPSLPLPLVRLRVSGDSGFLYVPRVDGVYPVVLSTEKIKRISANPVIQSRLRSVLRT